MELILIRHGETDADREGRLKNSRDFSPTLNSTGRSQATALARALETELPFHFCTSPIRRARETAQIISETLGVPFSVVEGLAEIDVGALEGLTRSEIRQKYPTYFRDWERNAVTARCPGGETIQELQDRAWRAVQRLAGTHTEETGRRGEPQLHYYDNRGKAPSHALARVSQDPPRCRRSGQARIGAERVQIVIHQRDMASERRWNPD